MSVMPRVLSDGSPAQLPTGTGGVTTVRTRVYAADQTNTLGDELTSAFVAGTITNDVDRDIKSTVALTWTDPTIARAFAWVALFVETTQENGAFDAQQVGLFRMTQPKLTLSDPGVTVDGTGEDVICLLRDAALTDTYTFDPGSDMTVNMVAAIEQVGLTRHIIPAFGKSAPSTGYSWKPGTTLLSLLNDACADVGAYSLWAGRTGIPQTRPFLNLATSEPTRTYTIGQDATFVGDLALTANDDSFANVIIVTREDPAKGTILKSIARNDNPLSPVSTVNIGEVARTITVNDAVDQSVLDARAQLELANSSILVSGQVDVRLDPGMDMHGVARIIVPDDRPDLVDAAGLWLISGWTLGLTPSTATTRLSIRRTELF